MFKHILLLCFTLEIHAKKSLITHKVQPLPRSIFPW